MKISAVVVICFALGACITSSTAKNYYQLNVGVEDSHPVDPLPFTVLVENVRSDDVYDDFRIIYRLSDFEINYYNDDFWVKKPSLMLRKSISRFLERHRTFERVILDLTGEEPDMVLKSTLRIMEEVDTENGWLGRLAMEFKLTEYPAGRLIAEYEFDRSETLDKQNVESLAATLSRILAEELVDMAKIMASRIRSDDQVAGEGSASDSS